MIWAAIVQALTAVVIAFLTWRLVETTKTYAAETKRMAKLMAEQESLDLLRQSRQVAHALVREILEAQRHASPGLSDPEGEGAYDGVHAMYGGVVDACLLHVHALVDPELRDRAEAGLRLAIGAVTLWRDRQYDKRWVLHRTMQGLKSVRDDLGRHARGEPLGSRGVPHEQRALDWLMAPSEETLDAFMIDP